MPEGEKKDVHVEVIKICQKIQPCERETHPDAIDVAHWVGKHRHGDPWPLARVHLPTAQRGNLESCEEVGLSSEQWTTLC